MKARKSLLLVAMAVFTSLYFIETAPAQPPDDSVYIKIEVDGLSCPFCAYGLEKFMYRVEGAKDVYISVQGSYTTFAVPAKDKPSEEELNKVVDKAGFTPGRITYSDKPFPKEEKSRRKKQDDG